MLLRRFIEHVKAQQWTAVALDFVIVVVGVFVGLQVQEWNSARGQRAAEIGHLKSMEEDVAYSIGSLEDMLTLLQRQQAARIALYEFSTNPAASLAQDERDRLVAAALFYLPRLSVRQVTFDALTSSGQLGAIGSSALISTLQSVSSDIAIALELQADETEVTYLFSDPLLVGSLDMAGVFRRPSLYPGKAPMPWLKGHPQKTPTPAVMKTLPFSNAILYRYFFTDERIANVQQILDQHRQIAKLIDERQAALGTHAT